MSDTAEETKNESAVGTFYQSLIRNNTKIRKDRGEAIYEDTKIIYKRKVEDLELKINRMKRDRDNMLDLSPTTADSLVLAANFDTESFVEKDMQYSFDLRNLTIQLNEAKERYKELFGE